LIDSDAGVALFHCDILVNIIVANNIANTVAIKAQ